MTGEYKFKYKNDSHLYILSFYADSYDFNVLEEIVYSMQTVRKLEALKQNISEYLLAYKIKVLEEPILM